MNLVFNYGLLLVMFSCLSCTESKIVPVLVHEKVRTLTSMPHPATNQKDKSLSIFARVFEEADAIHREAWWVVSEERRPVGKTPFGKIKRALMAAQNMKLSNKSMFRCDRYVIQRDFLGASIFPQRIQVFEKCSEKLEGRKIGEFTALNPRFIEVTFYPENLEEILGIGATVINRPIICQVEHKEDQHLKAMNCQNWNQDRGANQQIRLETYEYNRSGQNVIKLRGKVFENLTDIRKISADVPMKGKIEVVETELYAPEVAKNAEPQVIPSSTPRPLVNSQPNPLPIIGQQQGSSPPLPQLPNLPQIPQGDAIGPVPSAGLPPIGQPGQITDPDVLMQIQQQQNPSGTLGTGAVAPAPVLEPLPPPDSVQPVDDKGEQNGR